MQPPLLNNPNKPEVEANKNWKIRTLSSGLKLENDQKLLSLRLDSSGRWCSYRSEGVFYRRCYNGSVVVGEGSKELNPGQVRNLHSSIQKVISTLHNELGENQHSELIAQACEKGEEYYQAQAEFYKTAYPEDVPILPPDRYGDVVVQPAAGCPNRACTFCAFYKDKPFRVLPQEEFIRHLQNIKRLMGDDSGGRDSVFIGSANAMALSQRRLLRALDAIYEELGYEEPGRFKRGISAFSDPDFSPKRTNYDWDVLAGKNLKHLVIGLETGYPKLRGALGKASNLNNVKKAVVACKTAGIGVGLTVLTGVNSGSEQAKHHEATSRFISGLTLDKKDIVYISPFKSADGDFQCAVMEQKQLKETLKEWTKAKLVPYQMNRFRYYC